MREWKDVSIFYLCACLPNENAASANGGSTELAVIRKTVSRSRYLPEWVARVYHVKQRWDVVSCIRIKRSVNERLTRQSRTDRYGDIRDDRRSLMRDDADEIRYSVWATEYIFLRIKVPSHRVLRYNEPWLSERWQKPCVTKGYLINRRVRWYRWC